MLLNLEEKAIPQKNLEEKAILILLLINVYVYIYSVISRIPLLPNLLHKVQY